MEHKWIVLPAAKDGLAARIVDSGEPNIDGTRPEWSVAVVGAQGQSKQLINQRAELIVRAVNSYDALVEALEKYGDHRIGCLYARNPFLRCNCGYVEALAAARGEVS